MEKLTRSQRAADAVSAFCGSWPFIITFSGITVVWMSLNTALILFGVFDPYPYILLNLFLTVISTFQSPLIMMSQNRQMERDRDAVQGLHQKLDEMAALLERPKRTQLPGPVYIGGRDDDNKLLIRDAITDEITLRLTDSEVLELFKA